MLEMHKRNAQTHADGLSQNPLIIEAAKSRNAEALYEITAPIMTKAGSTI